MNDTKGVKEFKTGTLLCSCEHIDTESQHVNKEAVVVHNTLEIQNNLLATTDQVNTQSYRSEQLAEVIKQQKWKHLTKEQRKELHSAILDKSKLGLMTGPSAKINVADPRPSRGPVYCYPEETKTLIAELLQDMEDRKIIEKAASVWLLPIVLVNKPDGNKMYTWITDTLTSILAQTCIPCLDWKN